MRIRPAELYKIYLSQIKAKQRKAFKGQTKKADEIAISNEAKKMFDVMFQIELAAKSIEKLPDIREDKINEVQQKLKQGFYNNPKIYREVAKHLF